MIVFPESPIYLDTFGDDNRTCAVRREPIEAPYMVVLVDRKTGPDFYLDGRVVSPDNVMKHIRDAMAGRGIWQRLGKCRPDTVADLLALASAHHGGLPQHSVLGQTHNALELPSEARMPVGPRLKRKRTFTSP